MNVCVESNQAKRCIVPTGTILSGAKVVISVEACRFSVQRNGSSEPCSASCLNSKFTYQCGASISSRRSNTGDGSMSSGTLHAIIPRAIPILASASVSCRSQRLANTCPFVPPAIFRIHETFFSMRWTCCNLHIAEMNPLVRISPRGPGWVTGQSLGSAVANAAVLNEPITSNKSLECTRLQESL
jgi:hypothetical protein